MTVLIMSPQPGRILPTRQEVHDMIRTTAIAITAIIVGGVLVLAFVGAIVFLAYQGRSTEALTITLVTPLVAALVGIMSRLKSVESKMDALPSKVDGSQS